MVTNARELYDSILTDDLMFTLEPGNASRTKFAVMILRKIEKLDVDLLDPVENEKIREIKTKASEFLF